MTKSLESLIADIRLKHGENDRFAPILTMKELNLLLSALEQKDKRIAELEGENKFDTAKLINKFYTRYPLESFKSDPERSEALGYYMAGAEVQNFGDFVVYEMPEDDKDE